MWPFKGRRVQLGLAEYLFIDRPRLKSYVEQIKGPMRQEKIPTWDVSLSTTGPSLSRKQTSSMRAYTDHEMIEVLLKYLRRNKLLALTRPQHDHDVAEVFVLEKTRAQKAIFPINQSRSPKALKEISVWVSDPEPEELIGERDWLTGLGDAEGTFLYLVEAYWDSDRPCMTTYSNYSALNAIISELAREAILPDVPEPFLQGGKMRHYGEPQHLANLRWLSPIDSFQALGADIQPPRRIETLYRKRYLTDEQVFRDDKGLHRCNDLFAYPIYIRDFTGGV